MTPFSRCRSQPSGNTGGQHDALRLSCHNANWREHAERKANSKDALPTHLQVCFAVLQVLRCFFFEVDLQVLRCFF